MYPLSNDCLLVAVGGLDLKVHLYELNLKNYPK